MDTDFTNEQLKRIVRNNLQVATTEALPSRKVVVHGGSDNAVKCKECESYVDEEHFMKRGVCTQCDYSTHCKKAYSDHMIAMHSTHDNRCFSGKYRNIRAASHLGLNPTIVDSEHSLKCDECGYLASEGNDMGMLTRKR